MSNLIKAIKCFVCFLLVLNITVLSYAEGERSSQIENSTQARENTLYFGKISTNPKKHYTYLKPVADYVVSHMKDLGIVESKLIFARDTEQMVSYLKKGMIDWVTETPYTATVFVDVANAEMLLRRWKRGVPEYHTVFVTNKSSSIHSINDLLGKRIAFESPESTSAFLVPLYTLLINELNAIKLDSLNHQLPIGKVGYVFSGQEINMSLWLSKEMIDAIAYSNLDWDKKSHTPIEMKKGFRIFHRTNPFPRAIELVRKDLNPLIKKRLKEILLKIHLDPDAKQLLNKYQKTTKFDELDYQALNSIDKIRKAKEFVQKRNE